MEIKGNIGEEVFVKARIQGASIYGDHICYSLQLDGCDNLKSIDVPAENVIFQNATSKKKPEQRGKSGDITGIDSKNDVGEKIKPNKELMQKRFAELMAEYKKPKNELVNEYNKLFMEKRTKENEAREKAIGIGALYSYRSGTASLSKFKAEIFGQIFDVTPEYLLGISNEKNSSVTTSIIAKNEQVRKEVTTLTVNNESAHTISSSAKRFTMNKATVDSTMKKLNQMKKKQDDINRALDKMEDAREE